MAESIAREIHGARLEVLPDAAHLSFIEQPERFHAIFDAFLGHAAVAASVIFRNAIGKIATQ
jgi:3-oxoadipate enol-lactonase